MLKYLIILLKDNAVSFCHYPNIETEGQLIPLPTLRDAMLFAWKNNLKVQIVFPKEALPDVYMEQLAQFSHYDIVPAGVQNIESNVVVVDDWMMLNGINALPNTIYVIRTNREDFFAKYLPLKSLLDKVARVNVIFTDVCQFTDEDFRLYAETLSEISKWIVEYLKNGTERQFNLLTDRLLFSKMHNCNAGIDSITLAPDGKFYLCPAFYQQTHGYGNEGNLEDGLHIRNRQLLDLKHAPLCRNCDAVQCKRCIWLNFAMTLDVNIPSHEQCVIAHIERNASRQLGEAINKQKLLRIPINIPVIDYLDPFDVRERWEMQEDL